MSVTFACRGDPEGWGPVSRIRPFDLTSCFEEGAVLSPLLVGFLLSAVVACWIHRGREIHERYRRSVWILRAKVVRDCASHVGTHVARDLIHIFNS